METCIGNIFFPTDYPVSAAQRLDRTESHVTPRQTNGERLMENF